MADDDVLTIYRDGLDFFGSTVQAVPDGAWRRSSPCAGWTALDVLGHVGETTRLGAVILKGEPFEPSSYDPPGTAVDGDPAFWWNQQAAKARQTLGDGVDLDREVDSPMGRRTVREGLSFPAADLYLHGWDLGTATGQQVVIPDEAIAFIRGMFAYIPEDAARRPGVFDAAKPAPEGASPTEELIAFTGRDPRHVGG
ncbi:TIGR03086 family metal-binding protein [Gordonia sp. (in: high G+C Gram-positive bacteria)]|uniref:TIGR03086 family metal-binding protein n=1 Tax=Gordonia sp. (in: high G+C Gram-positive bacteria) TaxID=84139 RepID=UPI0039E538D7